MPTRRQTEYENWQRMQRQQQAAAVRAAGGRNTRAFTPYQPPPIPSGYYDPSLDAQRDAASRGLLNTEQDIGTAGRYAQEDYGFETGGIERGYGRGMEDIGVGRRYAREDYDRNVGLLQRSFQQLGRRQGEQARRYGVSTGGIALLSAAKRNENQAIERQGIDTGYGRQVAGFDLGERRLGEDRTCSGA